jgi:hypothetical protein
MFSKKLGLILETSLFSYWICTVVTETIFGCEMQQKFNLKVFNSCKLIGGIWTLNPVEAFENSSKPKQTLILGPMLYNF